MFLYCFITETRQKFSSRTVNVSDSFIRICYNYTRSLSCVSSEETSRKTNYLAQTSFHMSVFLFFSCYKNI